MKNPASYEDTGFFLAFPARFERAAFRLGGERSILLSYGNRGLGAADNTCRLRLSHILAQAGHLAQGARRESNTTSARSGRR